MFALILDSLGSTELAFILVVALIFFGPRKLPQLARSMGKSLAEFRKASEDFKRTWEREVALESAKSETPENSIMTNDTAVNNAAAAETSLLEPATPDFVVARQSQPTQVDSPIATETAGSTEPSQPLQKHDWL